MELGLTEAIDSLVVAPHADAVIEVAQQHSTLTAKLALALAELDRRREFDYEGYASMRAWCRDKLGWTNQTANRILKLGRRLLDLPVTREAWMARELSDGQVEIIVECVTDRRAGLWADHEAEIVPLLAPLDVLQTNRAMRDWAAKADAILNENEPPEEPPAEAMLVKTLDGRSYLKGTFDAEGTEIIATGLRLADSGDLDEPVSKRQGQALLDVFRFYLDHQDQKLGKRHRPHLNVVVNHDDLKNQQPGRTLAGVPLPGSTVRKIACDANIHRVITDGLGSILDYGRATRTIPPAVYTSLVLRDWGCRFPGCDRPSEWCEGHHVWHWEDGGPTNLSNLVLLCSKHHHVVHLKGWHLRLDPTGTVEVTDPAGRRRTSDPPGRAAAA
jgi:Domain of unknown function (DUF222)/HNH endonuclease